MAPKKKIDLSDAMEKLGDSIEKVSDAAGDAVKDAIKTAEPTVKKVAKKMEPTVKAARKAAEPTMKKAEKALKETGRKAAAALSPEVYVQWGGREADCADLVEKARADFKAQNKGAIRSCKLYVKPEDGMVYYVINGKEGKFAL